MKERCWRRTGSDAVGRRSNVTASRSAAISHPYLICQPPLSSCFPYSFFRCRFTRHPRVLLLATTHPLLHPLRLFNHAATTKSRTGFLYPLSIPFEARLSSFDRIVRPLAWLCSTNVNLNSFDGLLIPRDWRGISHERVFAVHPARDKAPKPSPCLPFRASAPSKRSERSKRSKRSERTERTERSLKICRIDRHRSRLVGIMGIDRTGRKRPSWRSGSSVRPYHGFLSSFPASRSAPDVLSSFPSTVPRDERPSHFRCPWNDPRWPTSRRASSRRISYRLPSSSVSWAKYTLLIRQDRTVWTSAGLADVFSSRARQFSIDALTENRLALRFLIGG